MDNYNDKLLRLRRDTEIALELISAYQTNLQDSYDAAKYALKKLTASALIFEEELKMQGDLKANKIIENLEDLFEK